MCHNDVYITYNIEGLVLHPITSTPTHNSFVGYGDDIHIQLHEPQYDTEPKIVAEVELTRVPSDLRNRQPHGYNMVEALRCEKSAGGHIIARDFDDPRLMERNIADLLKFNDVYIIRRLQVSDSYRNQGYGTLVLQNLKSWIHRITGDPMAIVVTVINEQNAELPEYARVFLQKRGFAAAPFESPVLYF